MERVEAATQAAWVATLSVLESADIAVEGFGSLKNEKIPKEHAHAAHAVRARLLQVLFHTARALAACGRMEALADLAKEPSVR